MGVSCEHYCVPAPASQPMRNRAELSDGRACEYTLVTRKSACPAVSRTSAGLAPRSRAWLQWAWRSQWGETALGRPARIAAAFTIRCTDMGSNAPPWRERKTGSSGPASPRSATSSRHIEGGSRIERTFPRLPTTVRHLAGTSARPARRPAQRAGLRYPQRRKVSSRSSA